MEQYTMYTKPQPKPTGKRKKILILLVTILCIAAIAGGGYYWYKRQHTQPAQVTEAAAEEPAPEPAPEPTQPALPNLQATVDEWVNAHPGTYSVKITDTSGNVLATSNADKSFFTASIYKLYVAYVGYQKIDDGTYKLTDTYLTGYNRGQCLDAMIRDSYSPCGEKMWAELGKQELTDKMKAYGLTGTSLVNLTTTANDAAIILANIENGKDLSAESRASFLDSMKTQDAKYRRGLPSGFANATVYNKVGWNEDLEWHDTAIVELPGGQKIVVSVLTSGVGYKNVAGLGAALQTKLEQSL